VTTDSNTNAAEKSMSIRECLDAVHKAGGNAWDKVADPDGFIRWMRGSDDPKDVAAADQAMQSMPVQSPASAPEQASVGAETTTGWKVEDHGADGMIVRDPSGMERSRIGSFTMAMVHLAMVLEEHDKLRAALTQLPRQSEDGQELFYSVYVHEQGHKLWQADFGDRFRAERCALSQVDDALPQNTVHVTDSKGNEIGHAYCDHEGAAAWMPAPAAKGEEAKQ
jgi:hypothetical protein